MNRHKQKDLFGPPSLGEIARRLRDLEARADRIEKCLSAIGAWASNRAERSDDARVLSDLIRTIMKD